MAKQTIKSLYSRSIKYCWRIPNATGNTTAVITASSYRQKISAVQSSVMPIILNQLRFSGHVARPRQFADKDETITRVLRTRSC